MEAQIVRVRDSQGEAPAKKPTSFLTNSAGLRDALGKRCPGCCRHVALVAGRASAAQIYPRELCRAVTRGIIDQARMDVQDLVSRTCGEEMAEDLVSIGNIEHDEDGHDGRYFWDDTSGEKLDPALIRAARKEEVEAIHDVLVYRKVPIAMCIAETGRRPIGTRWVDINKGDKLCPKIRSRLVAQALNRSKLPELFAGTPPLEFI